MTDAGKRNSDEKEGKPAENHGLHVPSLTPGHAHTAAVDPKLLEMLVCPLTRTTLEFDHEKNELVSRAARLAYPIRDAIPIMLASEARNLTDSELSAD